jgi:hypothetical protein
MIIRLIIGFWTKSGAYSDFSLEKAGHHKIQSIFRENRSKKQLTLRIFGGTSFKNARPTHCRKKS